MGLAVKLVSRLADIRGRVRFRLWVLRARVALARAGCRLEIAAPHGASFGTPPILDPTWQGVGEEIDRSRRGSLRIELGRWVFLGRQVTIEFLPGADSVLALGDGVVLGTGVRLMAFGGETRVGPLSRVRDGVTLKSSGRLVTGERTILQSYSMIHCAEEVEIEDRVTFGERVSVLDSDHVADGSDTYTQFQPVVAEPVRIARNGWIGANAVILRGARLGRNAVVAAGSVVRGGDYPAGWLVAGAPAEAKKPLPAAAAREGEPAG